MPAGSDSTAPGSRRWTAADALARALQILRQGGLRALVFAVLGETAYRRLVLFERVIEPAESPREVDPAVEVGWLGEDRLGEYEALRPRESERAARRLAAGHRCFATYVEGRLAGVRWVATSDAHVAYLDVQLELATGDVFAYDSFTAPAYRRRGLSTEAQVRLAETLRGEGHRRVLRAVHPENQAGMRDAARAGFRRRGRVGYVRLGPWRRELRRRGNLGRRARWVLVRALGRTVHRRLTLTERRLDGPVPLLEASVPLEFAFLDPAEAAAYSRLRSDPGPAEVVRRLERGDRCWTARREGRIVSARWVVMDADAVQIPYLGHRLELAPRQAYVYETFTAPDQRGCGVSGAASSRLARRLAAEGYRSMLAAMWPHETAIIRAHVKAGYEPVATIHSLGVGRLRRTFLRP